MFKDFLYEKDSTTEFEFEIDYATKKVRTGEWTTNVWGDRIPKTEEVIDKNFIISEHWHRIPSYCCRDCERPIIPYSYVFEGRETFAGFTTKHIFSQRNGYCRVCALKHAKAKNKYYPFPNYVKYPNEHAGETMYFLDENGFPTGEKIEEDLTLPNVKFCER